MNKTETTQIIQQLKAGNAVVLESIYKKNRRSFLKFAKKFKLPEDDIIDIYQDAIIALRDNMVLGKVEQLNSSLSTYLFSIGKYMIYNRLKNNRTFSTFDDLKEIEDRLIEHFEFYEENDTLKQQCVDQGFTDLGPRCQQILKLFYYDGMTLREIQEYLKYDDYNVLKSQKSRCLKTLKDLIDKQNPHE